MQVKRVSKSDIRVSEILSEEEATKQLALHYPHPEDKIALIRDGIEVTTVNSLYSLHNPNPVEND